MGYEEICERTITEIEIIMANLGKHVGLKTGVSFGDTGVNSDDEHTTDDALSFCAMFGGL